jgi:hypothetical protein
LISCSEIQFKKAPEAMSSNDVGRLTNLKAMQLAKAYSFLPVKLIILDRSTTPFGKTN